ncbi:hypothetical protein [Streptomyces sp. NPDC018947]|uniref:hypothetical protein n=1 Tax=Streptomyces sp. NPDC018947 TaxID=3365054 RepID=UPI0037A7E9B4
MTTAFRNAGHHRQHRLGSVESLDLRLLVHADASIRAYAADQRAKVDVLASVLEDIAANGYPSPDTGMLWEEARDAHLERLAGEQPRVA